VVRFGLDSRGSESSRSSRSGGSGVVLNFRELPSDSLFMPRGENTDLPYQVSNDGTGRDANP
jgi:hypothetical protein